MNHVQPVPVRVCVVKRECLATDGDTESRSGRKTLFVCVDAISATEGEHVVVPVLRTDAKLLDVVVGVNAVDYESYTSRESPPL